MSTKSQTKSDDGAPSSLKRLAFHAHFLASFIVICKHFYDPPSMPPIPGFGIIGITFALAVLLPPVGMISPEGFDNKQVRVSQQQTADSQTEKEEKKQK